MNNKRFVQTLLAVSVTTVFFYGFSSVGALAYTKIVSPVKKFTEQTYIGPFDVRGLDEHSAKDKLVGDFAELHSKLGAQLTYQDATVELPADLIAYDVDRTIELAVPGEENSIIAEVSRDGLQTVLNQQFSFIPWVEDDIEAIAEGIENELKTGIIPVNVHITDYMDSTIAETEIASFSLQGIQLTPALEQLVNELDGTSIEFNTAFSLLDFAKLDGAVVATNADLTMIASAFYGAVLRTNLDVVERNIGRELNPSIPAGFEAAINQQLGLDFIFRNPNHAPMAIQMEMAGDTLTATITGLPLHYTYDPYVAKTADFEPRTVRRFSATVPVGQVHYAEEGRKGMEVTVNRMVLIDGEVLEDILISTDFYAPLPIVEVHPLQKEETPSDDNSEQHAGVEGSADGEPNLNNSDPDSSDSESDRTSSKHGGTGNGTNNEENNGSGDVSTTKPGKTNGNHPVAPPVKDGNQYDKGGNLIK
ncbi:VanW family protein [Sporosarcina sp. 179-K 3D1 HS]|uniref:VanW family protein n=1 Tax=Sporosarcina sp. 179-K 3D1 HS TaxID=3232169 RepID=UPI0039A051BB